MQLSRRSATRSPISLVAMIDVLMILLVFFMVTSTYLDLNMVPLAESADAPADTAAAVPAPGGPLLVRLGADGQAHVGGRTLAPAALTALVAERLAAAPGLTVVVLPSPRAALQDLVAVMDAAMAGGAARLRIVRLEAGQ